MRAYLLLIMLALLTACAVSSTSISHIRLSSGELSTPQGESPVIAVNTVVVPDYLLRDELLHRDGEFRVRYDSAQRWAEPLDIGIQRVVASRIAARLDTRQVIRFPDVSDKTVDWNLDIRIDEFEADGRHVRLSAEAQFTGPGDPIVIRFDQRSSLAPSGTESPGPVTDGEAIAKSMSELLWQLTDQLAESIKN